MNYLIYGIWKNEKSHNFNLLKTFRKVAFTHDSRIDNLREKIHVTSGSRERPDIIIWDT